MTPLAWLLGLVLPACGAVGAGGLPSPASIDFAHLQRPAKPNSALAAPTITDASRDLVTPRYPVTADRLYAIVVAVGESQPRTFLAATFPTQRQVHFVARSALWNFPDLVVAEVTEAGPQASTLVLYSRSVYGYSDLGVNRQRLSAWLAAVQSNVTQPGGR